MKRICAFILFSPLFALSQKKFSLSGKIDGLHEGSAISLTDINTVTDTVAKAIVKKDGFVLKGSLKEPTLLSLNVEGNRKAAVFLENSNAKISANANELRNIKVTGSATHAAFDAFQKKFNPLFEKLGQINQQLQYRGKTDSLWSALTNTTNEIQKEIESFIQTNKASPVSSFMLAVTMQLTEDILVTERRFNSLKPAAVNNFYGKYVKDMINETKFLAVGSVAMDFTQADTLGTPVSLSSFRGKYVLVDFWASWCGPCRQENPNVVYNYNKFKDKKFTVLGVSLDGPGQKARWLQAIHADNLTWTHVSDLQQWNNAVAVKYKIQSIPQNFLIGPDGKIVAKNLRGPALETKLCELLGCN
ncbi:MAG TPA: TlpA disulfide reductase family protein [Chitinophagaceae bacterium]|nr:TlpA disulfide reductase family protein [Chitinophagaceae bacterium]